MFFSGDLVGSKGSFVISKEAITQPTSAVTWQLSHGRFHCLLPQREARTSLLWYGCQTLATFSILVECFS